MIIIYIINNLCQIIWSYVFNAMQLFIYIKIFFISKYYLFIYQKKVFNKNSIIMATKQISKII